MKLYVARDEDGLYLLFGGSYQPINLLNEIRILTNESAPDLCYLSIPIDRELYTEVTFENSPMEVELKLIEK